MNTFYYTLCPRSVNINLMLLRRNIDAALLALDVKHSLTFHFFSKPAVTGPVIFIILSGGKHFFLISHAHRRGIDVKHWLTTTKNSVRASSVSIPVVHHGSPHNLLKASQRVKLWKCCGTQWKLATAWSGLLMHTCCKKKIHSIQIMSVCHVNSIYMMLRKKKHRAMNQSSWNSNCPHEKDSALMFSIWVRCCAAASPPQCLVQCVSLWRSLAQF